MRAITASARTPKAQPIGIVTGNSPESGALLWRKVNSRLREKMREAFRGDSSYPRVLVHSLPAMGWSMELTERDAALRGILQKEVSALVASGTQIIGLACNTTQYYVEDLNALAQQNNAKVVSLARSVSDWLVTQGSKRIFVAGIGYVTQSTGWSAFNGIFSGANIIRPNEIQSSLIRTLAYDVKQGTPAKITYQKFRKIVRESGADCVLLLLTELSTIFDLFPRKSFGSVEIVDGMDLYAEDIARLALEQPRG
jgi:aspartate/glutamate racemase